MVRHDTTPLVYTEDSKRRAQERLRVGLTAYYSVVTDLSAQDVVNLVEQTLVIMDEIQAGYERVVRMAVGEGWEDGN